MSGDETAFWNLYKVNLHAITLRELLLFQSIYVCKTLTDVVDIVNDQPDPKVFYKSFLELNGANMTSILSFDSRSMSYLLDPVFSEHFSSDYPLFYRNKYQKGKGKDVKYFYRSAIDSALKNNQVRAVELIIKYIEDYQNKFESGYLFYRNFPSLLDKGIDIQPLLRSEVFNFQFDFDEWPSTHHNPNEYLRPFNESIFMIRKHYRTVFPEEDFAPIDDDDKSDSKKIDSSKIYKIRYSVNFLPILGAYVNKVTDPYTKEVTREVNNADVNILGLFCSDG